MAAIIAVIPARGGSKRLPGKNILPFLGRPLLAWSIDAARQSKCLSAVYVSTDDNQIALVARKWGAEVIDRPAEFSSDTASTVDVLRHACGVVAERGLEFSYVMTLQPTNPLRPKGMLDEAVAQMRAARCDSLMGVSSLAVKMGRIERGLFRPDYALGQQSRLTEHTFFENGLIYISPRDALLRGDLMESRICAYICARPFDEVDIDDELDFRIAERIGEMVRDRLPE